MYLRSGNWYKSGQRDQTVGSSLKSSEESVTNAYHDLEPIVEEEVFSDSTSSMSLGAQASEVPEYSMAFNMRLTFAKANSHGAQLYKDPMSRWVVKIEDIPTAFEANPWVNYQGDLYMGQGGERYMVTSDPENVDKWGQPTKVARKEGPPYEDSEDLKLLNAMKVRHIQIDDPNIVLYVRETDNYQSCYVTKKGDPSTIETEKVLYVYLQGMNTMKITPSIVDKFGIIYEPMEERMAQGMTWHGFPIPELAPRVASSIGGEHESQRKEESRGVPLMARSPTRSHVATNSRVQERSEGVMPSAPPMPEMHIHSTLSPRRTGPSAQEVPHRSNFTHKTNPRITDAREEASAYFPGRMIHETRRVRPANFQKWVKKFNGSGDPYDHLASFKQVARAEQVNDLHTKVEGFGLTLEGRALSWFQTLNLSEYLSYEALEKDFIAAFSKTGLKHDVLSQIHGFKQKNEESVRDGANRLRQYLARCPEEEIPSQERLVSIFLE